MPETSSQINEILKMGRKARTKEDQQKIMQMLADLSVDYSDKDYPLMGIDEFIESKADRASLSPQKMLESYYGENLAKEIIRAGNYNAAMPTIKPESFPAIFDHIRGEKTTDFGSSYTPNADGSPLASVSSGRAADIFNKNALTYREWLDSDDPNLRKRAIEHFRANSIDPTIPSISGPSSLMHEVGHHISLGDKKAELPITANNQAYIASSGFEDFGSHTGLINETTQALSRLQREMFKETGKRISNPKEFMRLVDSGEIPDFLTQEGRRILIYTQNLKDVRDNSDDPKKKKAAEKALEAISKMAPALVKNQAQNGLSLPLS